MKAVSNLDCKLSLHALSHDVSVYGSPSAKTLTIKSETYSRRHEDVPMRLTIVQFDIDSRADVDALIAALIAERDRTWPVEAPMPEAEAVPAPTLAERVVKDAYSVLPAPNTLAEV